MRWIKCPHRMPQTCCHQVESVCRQRPAVSELERHSREGEIRPGSAPVTTTSALLLPGAQDKLRELSSDVRPLQILAWTMLTGV